MSLICILLARIICKGLLIVVLSVLSLPWETTSEYLLESVGRYVQFKLLTKIVPDTFSHSHLKLRVDETDQALPGWLLAIIFGENWNGVSEKPFFWNFIYTYPEEKLYFYTIDCMYYLKENQRKRNTNIKEKNHKRKLRPKNETKSNIFLR